MSSLPSGEIRGFAPDRSFSVATAQSADTDLSAGDPRYLDTNIVAIYW